MNTKANIDALIERLDSHMGKQTAPVLLADCRLARDALKQLRTERDAALKTLKPFGDAAADVHEKADDTDHLWESPAAMSLTAGDLRRAAALMATDGKDAT